MLQLLRAILGALADPDVQSMVASARSSYINTEVLLCKCKEPWTVSTENLKECVAHVASVSGAILMLGATKDMLGRKAGG